MVKEGNKGEEILDFKTTDCHSYSVVLAVKCIFSFLMELIYSPLFIIISRGGIHFQN